MMFIIDYRQIKALYGGDKRVYYKDNDDSIDIYLESINGGFLFKATWTKPVLTQEDGSRAIDAQNVLLFKQANFANGIPIADVVDLTPRFELRQVR